MSLRSLPSHPVLRPIRNPLTYWDFEIHRKKVTVRKNVHFDKGFYKNSMIWYKLCHMHCWMSTNFFKFKICAQYCKIQYFENDNLYTTQASIPIKTLYKIGLNLIMNLCGVELISRNLKVIIVVCSPELYGEFVQIAKWNESFYWMKKGGPNLWIENNWLLNFYQPDVDFTCSHDYVLKM